MPGSLTISQDGLFFKLRSLYVVEILRSGMICLLWVGEIDPWAYIRPFSSLLLAQNVVRSREILFSQCQGELGDPNLAFLLAK